MDFRYPAGAPISPPGLEPDVVGDVDTALLEQQAQIRRRRSLIEPPPGLGVMPQIVPQGMYRRALADDISTRAGALSIHNDAEDAAFNARLDGAVTAISGFDQPEDLLHPAEVARTKLLEPRLTGFMDRVYALRDSTLAEPAGHIIYTPPRSALDYEHMQALDAKARGEYARLNLLAYNGEQPITHTPVIGYDPTLAPDAAPNVDGFEQRQQREVSGLEVPGLFMPQAQGSIGDYARAAAVGAGGMLGYMGDGRRFYRDTSTAVAATVGMAVNGGTYRDNLDEMERRFDANWDGYGPAYRAFIESANPRDVLLAAIGSEVALGVKGIMAAKIAQGGVAAQLWRPASIALKPVLWALDTGVQNPLKAIGFTVAAAAATRVVDPVLDEKLPEMKPGWAYPAKIPLVGGSEVDFKPIAKFGIELGVGAVTWASAAGMTHAVEGAYRRIGASRTLPPVSPEAWVAQKISRPLDEYRGRVRNVRYDLDSNSYQLLDDADDFGALTWDGDSLIENRTLSPGDFVHVWNEAGDEPFPGLVFRVDKLGEPQPFGYLPSPGVGNIERVDSENIARGAAHITSRIDWEARKGTIPEAEAELALRLANVLPPGYLNNLGISVRKLVPQERVYPHDNKNVLGLYDQTRRVITLAHSVMDNLRQSSTAHQRPWSEEFPWQAPLTEERGVLGTLLHEVGHHLGGFVPKEDAAALFKQYTDDFAVNAPQVLRLHRERQGAMDVAVSAYNELKKKELSGATDVTEAALKTARDEAKRQIALFSQAEAASYRYSGFDEWFAEQMMDRFAKSIAPAADTVVGRMHQMVSNFAEAIADVSDAAMGHEDTAARVYRSIAEGRYKPSNGFTIGGDITSRLNLDDRASDARFRAAYNRLKFDPMVDDHVDILPSGAMVGTATSTDLPAPLRAQLGDGGAQIVGNKHEIIAPDAEDMYEAARAGSATTLNAQVLPFGVAPRARGARGSAGAQVPNLMPVVRPAGLVQRAQATYSGMKQLVSNAHNVFGADERAKDLAAQEGRAVPTGIWEAIENSMAGGPLTGAGWKRIGNFVNGASNNPVVRQAFIAKRQVQHRVAAMHSARRAQFVSDVRGLMGSTDRLAGEFEYVGPAVRDWGNSEEVLDQAGNVIGTKAIPGMTGIPANAHELTGTIYDLILHPDWYSGPKQKVDDLFALLKDFNQSNLDMNDMLRAEYGMEIGDFSTGIGSDRGLDIFIASYMSNESGDVLMQTSAGGGRTSFKERTYRDLEQRLAIANRDKNVRPVTDLEQAFATLDAMKAMRAGDEAMRWSLGGSLEKLPDWQPVQLNGKTAYLPPGEAGDAGRYLKPVPKLLHNLGVWTRTIMGGDISPLTVQGFYGFLHSPYDSVADIASAVKARGWNSMKDSSIYEDMTADPNSWVNFLTWMEIDVGKTPEEWKTGLIERFPWGIGNAVAKADDAMSNILVHAVKADFDDTAARIAASNGGNLPEAYAAARDSVALRWMRSRSTQTGMTPGRAALERAAFISPTFIRNPATYMQMAAQGIGKLAASHSIAPHAQWALLDPAEKETTQSFVKAMGVSMGIAAASAAYYAEERGMTPEEAAYDAVFNPDSPYWMTLTVGGTGIPLLQPLRAQMRTLLTVETRAKDGDSFDVGAASFNFVAALANYGVNRSFPPLNVGSDILENKDYFGNTITTEDGWRGVSQALSYMVFHGIAPLTIGTAYDAVRDGQGSWDTIKNVAMQWSVGNPVEASPFARMEAEQRRGARMWHGMAQQDREAFGLTPEQLTASANTRSWTELKNALGAQAAAELVAKVNPEVLGRYNLREEDLLHRAERGQEMAKALALTAAKNRELDALSQQNTRNGVLDKLGYRQASTRTQSKYNALASAPDRMEILDALRLSDSPVDRATEGFYAIYDKARPTFTLPDGSQVKGEVDFPTLEAMQQSYLTSLGEPMATLVEQNMNASALSTPAAERELRDVRTKLRSSGYWDIEDKVWSQVGSQIQAAAGEDVPGVKTARNYGELRQAFITNIAMKMAEAQTRGGRPDEVTAATERLIPTAEKLFDRTAVAQIQGKAKRAYQLEWAAKNLQSGLLNEAQQWGYISNDLAITAAAAGAAAQGSTGDSRSQPAPAAPAPATTPKPRAENLDPLNRELVEAHDNGTSYGQLAIKHGLTRDAVIGRIKRTREASAATDLPV